MEEQDTQVASAGSGPLSDARGSPMETVEEILNAERIPSPTFGNSKLLKRVFLSLGSNLGDRLANLRSALEQAAEAGLEVRRVSSFYKTQPLEFVAQAWFLNCVAEVGTDLMPLQLLKTLKSIERALGRHPGVPRGPRPIDIDILLYENAVVHSAALTIPHERMSERRFVLVPLRELAPNLRHPVTQRSVLQMLADTPDKSQVVRVKEER